MAYASRGLASALLAVGRASAAERTAALRARTLVALAQIADDASAVVLRTEAYEIYRRLNAPQTHELTRQLGWDDDAVLSLDGDS
ncbi:hypothetical protein AB0J82_22720 [Asanoa sp. NPDC049518]|uniref:hypothetical protein n=1 Tax=unclassified Asanoa TaxID=2685164 RepID=UPI0034490E25